ncbi:MAG: hypothetical protein EPN93_18665 [Spirochaetes bacterium]|nr:MAG: hypothetical protein EPN93_18665 [Spirochaetota bacterium]
MKALFRNHNCGSAKRIPNTLAWMAVTVMLVHAALFILSVTALTVVASQSASRFAGLALEHHKTFLFWTNIDLLRGYALVSLGYVLLGYPVVRLWMGSRECVTRWAISWRTLALTGVIMAYCVLRLVHARPYFLNAASYDHWYFKLLSGLPEGVRPHVFFALFTALPVAAGFSAAVYYGTVLIRRLLPAWRPGRAAGVSTAAGALILSVWVAAPLVRGDEPVALGRQGPPNVLMLVSDSLRGDRLSCNGYYRPTTPHIDELAAKSVNFQRMMTPVASTLESMTTIMTGQYPHTHGFRHMYPSRERVDATLAQSPTLAGALAARGYETAAMGDWCAGIFNVVPLGFREVQASDFDDFKLYMAQAVYIAHFIIPLYFDNELGYRMFPRLQSFATYVTPDVVTDRLVERLDRAARGGDPFFITAFYSCTHIPYYCPPPYHELYADPAYNGRNKFKMDFNVDSFIRGAGIEKEFAGMPPHEVRQIRDLYDGAVNFFDSQVGRVLAGLERAGLAENTIVIVTSDHGDDLFEPNTSFSHGLSFNGGDQTNRIPFVMYVPGGRFAPAKVAQLTRTIDIAPTVLEVLDVPRAPGMEGTSLLPYLEGTSTDLSLAFFGETSYLFFRRQVPGEEPLWIAPLEETTAIDPDFDFHFVLQKKYEADVLRTKERCISTRDWKLVHTPGVHRDIWRLFHLPTDPHCERDVKRAYPRVWRAMQAKLRMWADERRESRVCEIFPSDDGGAPWEGKEQETPEGKGGRIASVEDAFLDR